MARQRSWTGWSYTFCACTTQSIHAHGMRASPMYNIAIIGPFTTQPITIPFSWGWDSDRYVLLTYTCHLQLLKLIQLMSSLKFLRRTASLSAFKRFANRFMTYWAYPMLSTISGMISIRCNTTSRWAIKCGYICRRSASVDPTQASPTSIWVIHHHQGCKGQFLWAQYSTIPWSTPNVQCGSPSALLSTSTRHIRRGRTN